MKIKITPEQYFSLQRENAELKAKLSAVQDDMAEMRSQFTTPSRKSVETSNSFAMRMMASGLILSVSPLMNRLNVELLSPIFSASSACFIVTAQ